MKAEHLGIIMGYLDHCTPSPELLEKTAAEHKVPAEDLKAAFKKEAIGLLTALGIGAGVPLAVGGGKWLANRGKKPTRRSAIPGDPAAEGDEEAPETPFARQERMAMQKMEDVYNVVARNRARQQKYFALADFLNRTRQPMHPLAGRFGLS